MAGKQKDVSEAIKRLESEIKYKREELQRLEGRLEGYRECLSYMGEGESLLDKSVESFKKGPTGKTNWKMLFKSLPNEFDLYDLYSFEPLRGKKPSRIRTVVSRWVSLKLVKRIGTGRYVKV